MFKKKERISKKALIHSSLGEFKENKKTGVIYPTKGGHGQENIKELEKQKIPYKIEASYPNGVRLGNMPTHKQTRRRQGNFHSWFPKNWNKKTIKKAGEKVINSIPYKLPDNKTTFGIFKKVKIAIKRNNGKVTTVFPYYKQRGSLSEHKTKNR